MNKEIIAMVTTPITVILIVIRSFVFISNSPYQITNAALNGSATKKPLPVLLIHGYASDKSTWSKWEDLLKKDGITFYSITFYKSDDKCGSAADYEKELNLKVQQILKHMTTT